MQVLGRPAAAFIDAAFRIRNGKLGVAQWRKRGHAEGLGRAVPVQRLRAGALRKFLGDADSLAGKLLRLRRIRFHELAHPDEEIGHMAAKNLVLRIFFENTAQHFPDAPGEPERLLAVILLFVRLGNVIQRDGEIVLSAAVLRVDRGDGLHERNRFLVFLQRRHRSLPTRRARRQSAG